MRRAIIMSVVMMSLMSTFSTRATAHEAPLKRSHLVTVGRLSIEKLKVNVTIYKGVTEREFDRGVGYWPGSALPGDMGNMVIGGHRTSAHRPFYDIQKLKVGDIIVVTRPQHTVRYRVTRKYIVKPTDLWIIKPTSTPSLTLFTCHPRGSVSKRYAVRATLVE
jgi:sortase A